ncbi:MarR family winged helix-turn-helix transcriptional regulator [Criblamydia sequanensis]|uniref:Transcriptional regulator n=1 Tax=Candidatus Criblamydia sequanensis CRIB-18 TaxID=1437425 RepID=A0A090DZQ4_9BACT|nr:MarR family transcriptional regulator [Criblamydia sequanensis]CDR34114.1 Transcriptional regulator [Criblamydia sequanensis CRIB-18]
MKKSLNFKEISVHDTPGRSLGFLLWHVSTAWRGSIEAKLKSLDLTHPQFVILATLGWLTRKGELVTQALVGKMAGLDPNTVSQIIKGLEKKGLIKRQKSSDARVKNPLLTLKGQEKIREALPIVEEKDAQFFHSLTSNEIESLIRIFNKLIKN